MSRVIAADVAFKTEIVQRVTIEWPDELGEPTDENVLQALKIGKAEPYDVLDENYDDSGPYVWADVFDKGEDS